jgi:hypothetical protein
LRQVGGFVKVFWFPTYIKTDHHDITEILLKYVRFIVGVEGVETG